MWKVVGVCVSYAITYEQCMGCLLVGENVILLCYLEALSHPLLIGATCLEGGVEVCH
jgi:hypothetical protein